MDSFQESLETMSHKRRRLELKEGEHDSTIAISELEHRPRTRVHIERNDTCIACGSAGHLPRRHPYANTAEGFLVGCVLHNTYSHATGDCEIFTRLSLERKVEILFIQRSSMAPVYVGEMPRLTLANMDHASLLRRAHGPYTPGFASRIDSGSYQYDARIRGQMQNEGHVMNDLNTEIGRARLQDLEQWSATQVYDPFTKFGYLHLAVGDWPTFGQEWAGQQYRRLRDTEMELPILPGPQEPVIPRQLHHRVQQSSLPTTPIQGEVTLPTRPGADLDVSSHLEPGSRYVSPFGHIPRKIVSRHESGCESMEIHYGHGSYKNSMGSSVGLDEDDALVRESIETGVLKREPT